MKIVSQKILSIFTSKKSEKCELPVYQAVEFLKAFQRAGGTSQDLQAVIESKGNEKAKEIVNLLQNGLYEPTPSHKAAKEIMGNNYFGPEDAAKYLGVRPTRKQLIALAEIPYSKATLLECKDTHLLVAVFPMSLMEMLFNKRFADVFDTEAKEKTKKEFRNQIFALDPGEIEWRLVRKSPEKDSLQKEWIQQLQILGEKNRVASARVVVYAVISYFLKTGEQLFNNDYVHLRCVETEAISKRRITIIPLGEKKNEEIGGRLRIEHWWDDNMCYFVGLASMRKHDFLA
jgi:hypothetical protein